MGKLGRVAGWVGLVLLAVAALMWLGMRYIPGVGDGQGGIDAGFRTAAFLELLSFLLTAAAIGPLTAYFVQRRADREWLPARRRAEERLGSALGGALSAWQAFVELMEVTRRDPFVPPGLLEKMRLGEMIERLDEFLDAYDEEHPTFTVGMHAEGSLLRRELLRFSRLLKAHRSHIDEASSMRVLLHKYDVDRLRALFDLPRLQVDATGDLEAFRAIHDDAIPIDLASDPLLVEQRQLSLDVKVDGLRRGPMLRFTALDMALLKAAWRGFVAAYRDGPADSRLLGVADLPADRQDKAYARFLRENVAAAHFLDNLLPEGERTEQPDATRS